MDALTCGLGAEESSAEAVIRLHVSVGGDLLVVVTKIILKFLYTQ